MAAHSTRQTSNNSEVVVEVRRGTICESVHKVDAVAVSPSGAILGSFGDRDYVTTLRSAAKPLQAIPLFTLEESRSLPLASDEIAICCASHSGFPRHTALAASVLALSGYLPDNLVCGIPGLPESPLKHGCSGNHAAILLIGKMLGADPDGYYKPDHPAQMLIRRTIAELSGFGEPPAAVDGCGIPTFGLSLIGMARAFAELVRPGAPWERIPAAMAAFPELIGSEDWIDVRLMQATDGRIIAKTGAEGLLCLADRSSGAGMAVKVIDGSTRALGPATIAVLGRLGWLSDLEISDERLSELSHPQLRATTGEAVAEIVASLPEE